MGGGKSKTVYQQSTKENPYDDAWIRDKFGQQDIQGLNFQNWMTQRQSQLGREQDFRDQLRRDVAGLQSGFAGAQANIANLQKQGTQLSSNFTGLSQSQQQQMKDLYNLANQQGSGVYGVQTPQGVTFTAPKTTGTGSLNRESLQTGSLNI